MSQPRHEQGLHLALLSLHGLIRAKDPELGRDNDTGGQIKYVLELARELAHNPGVRRVDLITRQIFDDRVGPDYANVEEPIDGNARVIRIPFGPKRYLRKEALWPFLEVFIDQTVAYFRRTGVPDVIHGHYADAGYAGAQLARLLGVPFVFTGHSLGRVKLQQLLKGKADRKTLERKYHFGTRNEAEEVALETASLVVASTGQEVEQQYQLYEHYVPERMEVIPPGVDLSSFMPPEKGEAPGRIADEIARFVKDPDKPFILAMARPDERKNVEMLVRVYGECEELRRLANLVILMGTRDDIRELPKSQRRVLQNVITLIDVYDLYGQVAYPKQHSPSDVPELYRLAAMKRGVFVNPALTEPFGLTLLEAAASGLPIVATNDGGPRDIIANCQNGLLIDPFDQKVIEKALLRVLTEPEHWETWSRNGIAGALEHYSWKRHADRYLRDVTDLVERVTSTAKDEGRKQRRLPQFDRMIITDIDNTLTGDDEGLKKFIELIKEHHDRVGFGVSTGRKLESAVKMLEDLGLPRPDVLDTAVGTELYYGEDLTPDISWRKQIAFQWNPEGVHQVLDKVPGLFLQPKENQSEFKISYQIDPKKAPKLGRIRKLMREAGLRVKVVLSLKIYLDVIPVRGGSEMSIRHLAMKWGFSPEHLLIAGDSGNDEGMLKGRSLGVVVGNHSSELNKLRKHTRVYFAEGKHAWGIIEGIKYYNFLDHITIPNDGS